MPSNSAMVAEVFPNGPTVGQRLSVLFTYCPETAVIGQHRPNCSGYVEIRIPAGWEAPQCGDSQAGGYVTATISSGASLRVECSSNDHDTGAAIRVYPEDTFEAGGEVHIVYGDRSAGGPGALAPGVATTFVFFVFEDIGLGLPWLLAQCPKVTLAPEKGSALHVVCPSEVGHDDEIPVRVVPVDRYGNAVSDGGLSFAFALDGKPLNGHVPASGTSIAKVFLPRGQAPISRVEVHSRTSGIKGQSNPIARPTGEYRHFWGDIHGHTELTDACGSPETYYPFGRDVANLDFCALTDHDFELGNGMVGNHTGLCTVHPRTMWQVPEGMTPWAYVQDLADRYHEPGRFVTLLGYEWSSGRRFFGDRTVLYPGSTAPIHCHASLESHTPEGLFKCLAESGGISILHGTVHLLRFLLDGQVDGGAVQPLVEIYSEHGCSESHDGSWTYENGDAKANDGTSVQDLLARGWRLGFVAAGDSHSGTPGRTVRAPIFPDLWRRDGLTCVLAAGLSRATIFEAIKMRRCYATTGERILLDFRMNDALMGSEIRCVGRPGLTVSVHGTAPIECVEVIRNNTVFHAVRPEPQQSDVTFELEGAAPDETDFYYVRVRQCDGNRAWASPIWVTKS
ncbi:MAG: DUF3604 domain-containing protein [Nitrospiraceae bacterium]|nr:DUF3604 domain-containing protein [Nitrospiraceae bacterium]